MANLQAVAFVHGHRGSWHNPDVATDLRQLFWGQVQDYLPLSRKYFESFGPWFWSYPSKPERHLQHPIATGEAATNGSFLKHEVCFTSEAFFKVDSKLSVWMNTCVLPFAVDDLYIASNAY